MQQYTHDLWKVFQEIDSKSEIVGPSTRLGYVSFPFHAVLHGVRAARGGEIIHLGDMALGPLARVIKLFAPRARITATACGLDVIYPSCIYQWMLKRSLSSLDRIICISHATADALFERGVDKEKISVIPCGVWMNDEQPAREQDGGEGIRLLTIGRLVPRKGIAWFIGEVLPLILTKYPGLSYTVIGEGPEESPIKKVIQEKGLCDAVHIVGPLNDKQRNHHLSNADCLVVPNVPTTGDMEGFGIVCIEASSRGVPVAAASMEGLIDAVRDGETGRFFSPQDTEDCIDTICKLLSERLDPQVVSRCTQEHYGWKHLLPKYRDALFTQS